MGKLNEKGSRDLRITKYRNMMNSPLIWDLKEEKKDVLVSIFVRIIVQVPKLEFWHWDCEKWIDSGHITDTTSRMLMGKEGMGSRITPSFDLSNWMENGIIYRVRKNIWGKKFCWGWEISIFAFICTCHLFSSCNFWDAYWTSKGDV